MIGVVGLSVLTTESVGEVNDIWNPLVPPKADVVPAVVIIATHVMRYIPAPAAGTEYSVVAVIAADCAVRSTVAISEGTPADTVATPAYLMTLLNDRLPVKSPAVPLPIARDAAPRREMPLSSTAVAVDALHPYTPVDTTRTWAGCTSIAAAPLTSITMPLAPPAL